MYSVRYAYPSSINAQKLRRYAEGCWYVAKGEGKNESIIAGPYTNEKSAQCTLKLLLE
jgi:hypothetical protein